HGHCSLTPIVFVEPTLTHQAAVLPLRATLSLNQGACCPDQATGPGPGDSPGQVPGHDPASRAAIACRPSAGWYLSRVTSPSKCSTRDPAPLIRAARASSGGTVPPPATTRHGTPWSRAAAATPATTLPRSDWLSNQPSP